MTRNPKHRNPYAKELKDRKYHQRRKPDKRKQRLEELQREEFIIGRDDWAAICAANPGTRLVSQRVLPQPGLCSDSEGGQGLSNDDSRNSEAEQLNQETNKAKSRQS